jgi:hypothetical protein
MTPDDHKMTPGDHEIPLLEHDGLNLDRFAAA